MAQVHYVGKNGNRELDRERIEGLRLSNEIQRVKLQRLGGDMVDKREVTFALSHMLLLLRSQILTVPQLVASELRDLDTQAQHRVRMRVEDAIHGFLEQLAENMERTINSEEFIAELERNLTGNGKKDDDTEKLRKDLAKKRRTAKRHEKATR